jgi:hypothetical protein
MSESDSEYVADEDVAAIAAATETLLLEVSAKLSVACDVSKKTVFGVSRYFLRDINRIRDRQDGSISSIKFAGYWGFWIRKLKPLSKAYRFDADKNDPNNKIIEINELVALEISVAFLLRIGVFAEIGVVIDLMRGNCARRLDNQCDGAACVMQSAIDFKKFNNALNLRYIVYSMRHRTFGPHHLVTNLDHIVFGACKLQSGI